jgi:hypothetical protein
VTDAAFLNVAGTQAFNSNRDEVTVQAIGIEVRF